MWTKLLALAVTIPMTITIASAQASQDADIAAYSQDLALRIARGRQSGQLTPAHYNSVQTLYNNVEMIRRGLGNRPMNPMVRMNMMTSLTTLDKQLTGFLHDDVNSRYQMWDPNRKSWRNNWWQADTSGANNFNSEIDAYQNNLKQRIDQGRQSGQITRAELAQLTTAYENLDRAQQQYRIGGFSTWERNSLMAMLTQLDKDITAQRHDDENSHYRHWNANSKGWNNPWWQSNTSGADSFNAEIDAYQNSLKARIDKGRQSGKITRAELAQLTTSYENVDRAQQQYRIGGFNSSERNSLMGMLTQLDKDITAQMRDDENSHYRNWNPNTKGWNNSWWKNANTTSNPSDGRPGDSSNRDWNRSDSNRSDSTNRSDTGRSDWNRGDGIRSNSNTKDWNGGSSNRGGWSNRAGFGESNESINRSSNPSSGTTSGGSSSTGSSTTRTYTPPSNTGNSGATTNNPTPVSPPPTTPPASTTPPAATNNPPAGTGSPGTGATEGRRGKWGGEGRGDRTGEGRGDRTGTWERKPQTNP